MTGSDFPDGFLNDPVFSGLSLKISADCFQTGNTLGGILHLVAGLVCIFSANASVNRAIALADAQRAAAASASARGTVNESGIKTNTPLSLQQVICHQQQMYIGLASGINSGERQLKLWRIRNGC